jgi:MYXO-CTERM domain-containing protein
MTRAQGWLLGCGIGVVAAGLIEANVARACTTTLPPPALVGMPADGDTGVATDVRPVYDVNRSGLRTPDSATFELTSASGATVPITLQHRVSSHFEIVPARELEPLTTYTLRGRWRASSWDIEATGTLSFTTGAGPVDGTPEAPRASMRHYRLHGAVLDSCAGPAVGTCVSLPLGGLVQVSYLDSFGQEIGPSSEPNTTSGWGSLTAGPFFDDLAGIDQGTNFSCVVLRTRAANGSLSSPTVMCGSDAPLFELTVTGSPNIGCTPEGLTHDGALVVASETSAAGCSVAPAHTSRPALLAPLLVALGAFARRRTSRRAETRLRSRP